MIVDRPNRVHEFGDRILVPPKPFTVSWEWIPENVRVSLIPIDGIQPVTRAMIDAANGAISTAPTSGEIEHFSEAGTQFQLVQLVLSLAWWESERDGITAVPFAISALPASKRGEVTHCGIELVSALHGAPFKPSTEEIYAGFDPFVGEWGMGIIGGDYIAFSAGRAPIDELGIVVGRYFLALDVDRDEVLEADTFVPNEQSQNAYKRNRFKKLYTPFKEVQARRIWGLESPIELFLLQELTSRGLRPNCQCLIYPDGSVHQSLYDVYADIEFRRGQKLVTEADLYFPEKKVAVFCDGSHHERRKQKEKDAKIDEKLKTLGIQSVRIPGKLIIKDLSAAGDCVSATLAQTV